MPRPPGQLVTPEAVVLHLQHAGPATRILARILDILIELACLVVLTVALGVSGAATGGVVIVVVYLFAVVLLIFGYPAILESVWRGRTFGKAAFGLRVVTREGAPIRFRHAVIRSMLFIVDGLIAVGLIGIVSLLVTADTVRLGDLAAGTIVVRERSGAPMPEAMTFPPPPGCEAYVASLDVSGVTAAEYGLIRSFLGRARQLAPASREAVARQLATPLSGRLHHGAPPWMGPEYYLWCVAAAIQRRHTPAGYPASPGWGGTEYPAPGSGGARPAPVPPPAAAGDPFAPPG